MNPRNAGHYYGHLSQDAQFLENRNGSHKMRITVSARNNYRRRGEEVGSTFADFERYLSEKVDISAYPYSALKTGAEVALGYELREDKYVDRATGEKRRRQYCHVTDLSIVRQSRRAQEGGAASEDGRAKAAAVAAAEDESEADDKEAAELPWAEPQI